MKILKEEVQGALVIISLVLALCFVVFGCQAPVVAPKPVTAVATATLAPVPAVISWETGHPERAVWSSTAARVIGDEFSKLDKAQDIARFCPPYLKLHVADRITAWVELIAAVSYYESGWKPTSRMHETTMGKDEITGGVVYSEGLLQLSYQDIRGYKFCKFDWSADKRLAPTDPAKTILDPLINLECGIKILSRIVERRGKIALTSNPYWAVLKDGGKYSKIDKIASRVQANPVCR